MASRSACHGLFIGDWKSMVIARERGFLCVWILFYAFIKQIFPSVASYAPRFSRFDKTTMFPPVVYRLSTEREEKKYRVFALVYCQSGKMIQKLRIISFLLGNKLITWVFTWFEFWNVSIMNKCNRKSSIHRREFLIQICDFRFRWKSSIIFHRTVFKIKHKKQGCSVVSILRESIQRSILYKFSLDNLLIFDNYKFVHCLQLIIILSFYIAVANLHK